MPKRSLYGNNQFARQWETTLVFCVLTVFALVMLRLWMASVVPLTDTTEARYAEIARKMVETNNWITPQFAYDVPFWGKPPLAFWISAIGIKLFGVNELAARLGIYSLSLLFASLFFVWLKTNLGRFVAASAVLIMLSSLLYFVSTAAVMTDLVLAATVALSLTAFWQRFHWGSGYWEMALYIGIGLGLLSKGPIAVIFIMFPIAMWTLVTNNIQTTWQRFAWLKGGVLALLIALPWYVLAEIRTPGFLEYFIVGEHINRFLVSDWSGDLYGNPHSEQPGMIWLFLVAGLFPWSFLLLPFFWLRRHSLIANWRVHKSLVLFGLLWGITPLLLFTFSHNIILPYPLPGIPGFILVLAMLLAGRNELEQQRFLRFVIAGSLGMAVIYAIIPAYIDNGKESTIKYSQKKTIEAINTRCDTQDCGIYFWKKRIYSAEFYSQGAAVQLNFSKQLMLLADNDKKDYLVIEKGAGPEIAAVVGDRFQVVGQVGKMELLEEKINISELRGRELRHAF